MILIAFNSLLQQFLQNFILATIKSNKNDISGKICTEVGSAHMGFWNSFSTTKLEQAQPKSYFDWVSPWAFWVGPTQVTVIEINPTMRQGLGCLMYGPAGLCHMGWALPFGLWMEFCWTLSNYPTNEWQGTLRWKVLSPWCYSMRTKNFKTNMHLCNIVGRSTTVICDQKPLVRLQKLYSYCNIGHGPWPAAPA